MPGAFRLMARSSAPDRKIRHRARLRCVPGAVLLGALPGCVDYGPKEVAGPHVKLEDAFTAVGLGMRNLDASLNPPGERGLRLGVIVCGISVRFHVNVSAEQDGSRGVTIATPPNPYVTLSGSARQEDTALADTGNVVTVELKGTTPEICGRASGGDADAAGAGGGEPKRSSPSSASSGRTPQVVIATVPGTKQACILGGDTHFFLQQRLGALNGSNRVEVLPNCPQEH